MKVNVLDSNNNLVKVNESVTKVRFLNDGRYLVTFNLKCRCCNQDALFVNQVPKDYSIQIVLEKSDEIICNKL